MNKIDLLYELACTIKCVIEENDELKQRNKYLESELDRWGKYTQEAVKNHWSTAGDIIKVLMKYGESNNNKQSKSTADS